MVKAIYFFIFLLLASCAQVGPKYSRENFTVKKDKSIITIYRPWKFGGSIGDPYTCLDNVAVGEYYNGTYYDLEVTPGEHILSAGMMNGQKHAIKFVAKSGEQYFLRFEATKLTDAKESAQSGAMVGGATAYLVTGNLFAGKKEIEDLVKNVDKRIQQEVSNPGLFFVTKEFAVTEITETKLYNVKKYSKTTCEE